MVNRYKMTFNHSLTDLWSIDPGGAGTSNTVDSTANKYYVNYYTNAGIEGPFVRFDTGTGSLYQIKYEPCESVWYTNEIDAIRDLWEHAETIRAYFREERERLAKEDEDAQIAGKLGDAAELLFGGMQ